MRRVAASMAALLLATTIAQADEVGIVVAGDEDRRDALASHLKSSLRKRGHEVVDQPMKADAIQNLADCLAIDDQNCARGVIEKRSATNGLVYAVVTPTGKRTASVQMYWFVRGHQGASERRGCEKCGEDALNEIADDMLATLAETSEAKGRIMIRSHPEDLLALIDNEPAGQTPLQKDLPPGKHKVVITRGGENVGEQIVEIEAGETSKVTLSAHTEDSKLPQKVGSIALITGGFALLVTAGVLISYGSKDGPAEMYVYDNATGIGLLCGGVGLLGVVGGALLWPRSTQRTVPIAALGPAGGFLGLAGRF
jgi:hypothetical protein